MTNLVWLRRNLRLDDNLPLFKALQSPDKVQLVFILDSDILSRFPNPLDKRLAFIKIALQSIDCQLQKYGGKLLVCRGRPQELIPIIAKSIGAKKIFADEDYEPANIQRDADVAKALDGIAELQLYCDHLIFHPKDILKSDVSPFKIYTPYMKAFRNKLSHSRFLKYNSLELLQGRVLSFPQDLLSQNDAVNTEQLLESVIIPGYDISKAHDICDDFILNKMKSYQDKRDAMSCNGTSKLSAYLRFGVISIRELFRKAYDKDNSFTWINELIWREFYTSILYHFPYSANSEFNSKYANIPWGNDEGLLSAITNARTGYPIIDAAINELIATGWMHNRARMIVASFWTKNLFLDWRLGEEFFAQHLMDYELASNVGGWQWSASCGTDAQPYFRVFNPMLQSQKFDALGEYIKRYIPFLRNVPVKDIHNIDALKSYNYIPPIVDYVSSRNRAIYIFKNI